jgi:hypothetical protein
MEKVWQCDTCGEWLTRDELVEYNGLVYHTTQQDDSPLCGTIAFSGQPPVRLVLVPDADAWGEPCCDEW